jgi:hypothetical protein
MVGGSYLLSVWLTPLRLGYERQLNLRQIVLRVTFEDQATAFDVNFACQSLRTITIAIGFTAAKAG